MTRIANSINGVPVTQTDRGWNHIQERHPEIERPEQVLDTVSRPDLIQRGDFGALLAVRRLDGTYQVVVYRELTDNEGFVITAYLVERLRGREILWNR